MKSKTGDRGFFDCGLPRRNTVLMDRRFLLLVVSGWDVSSELRFELLGLEEVEERVLWWELRLTSAILSLFETAGDVEVVVGGRGSVVVVQCIETTWLIVLGTGFVSRPEDYLYPATAGLIFPTNDLGDPLAPFDIRWHSTWRLEATKHGTRRILMARSAL